MCNHCVVMSAWVCDRWQQHGDVMNGVTSVDGDWQKQADDHIMTIIKELPPHCYVALNTEFSQSLS